MKPLLLALIIALGVRVLADMNHLRAEHHFSRGELYSAVYYAPWNWRYRYMLAYRLMGLKKWKEAEKEWHRVLLYFPWYFDAVNNYGAALAQQGQKERARNAYKWILDRWPTHLDALENLEVLDGPR